MFCYVVFIFENMTMWYFFSRSRLAFKILFLAKMNKVDSLTYLLKWAGSENQTLFLFRLEPKDLFYSIETILSIFLVRQTRTIKDDNLVLMFHLWKLVEILNILIWDCYHRTLPEVLCVVRHNGKKEIELCEMIKALS